MGHSAGRTITLGAFIDALEKANPKSFVLIDFGNLRPTTIRSWRGDYSELALGFSMDGDALTAKALLDEAVSARGRRHNGYKGGEYIASHDTPLRIDNWGCVSPTVITGVDVVRHDDPESGPGWVTILTARAD